MNLKQSLDLAQLREKGKSKITQPKTKKISASSLAKYLFQIAAQAGDSYGLPVAAWQKKWLASEDFVLTEIETGQAALAVSPSSHEVQRDMHASADSLKPIVVDVNKNGIGRSFKGYVPRIIVVDGGSRQRVASLQGHEKIQAWVGTKALKLLMSSAIVTKARSVPAATTSKLESAAILSRPVPRQDTADQTGSARHTPMPTVLRNYDQLGSNTTKVVAGAQPAKEAAQEDGSPWIDPNDDEAPFVKDPGHMTVRPRLKPSPGGSQSEMAKKLDAGPIKLDKIDVKKIKAGGPGSIPVKK